MTGLTIHLFYYLFFICLKKQECPLLTSPYISPMRPGEGVVACIFPRKINALDAKYCIQFPTDNDRILFSLFFRKIMNIFGGGVGGAEKITLGEEHSRKGSFKQELHTL